MPLALLTTTKFEKDFKRVRKQGKDLDKLAQQPLPPHCRPHPLRVSLACHWDCHVEPDWLLLYRVTETDLILVRTGSHAELFR